MPSGVQRADEQMDLTYQLKTITYFENRLALNQKQRLHGILIRTGSSGALSLDGNNYSAENGNPIFIHASTVHNQRIQFEHPTSGYHIEFYALKEQENGIFKSTSLPFPTMLSAAQAYLVEEKAGEISKYNQHASQWSRLRANMGFQEIIYLLFHELKESESGSIQQVIQNSQEYISRNYQSEITREQLAQMAGLHVDYYSRKFKQHYQVSPIAYLNDVRMNQAKKLLLETQLSVHSIAKQVGFNDEFYFSRKFKRNEGFSPTVFINKVKRSNKIASLNHLVTGHLMALGIEPYAAIINHSFPAGPRLNRTVSIGDNEPDLERLLSTKPELIVRCASAPQIQSMKEELFTHIAPTVTLDFQDDWRVHLEKIARLIGREHEAEAFLTRYTEKAESIRQKLNREMGGETILIIGVGDGVQCVYGTRNIGTVLYGDLQLSAPVGIERIEHYQEVSLDTLAAYQPDRILLTVYRKNNRLPSSETIRKQVATLQNNVHWQSMKAVQQNKVHAIFEEMHLYTSYNSFSHQMMLDKMEQLMEQKIL